MTRLPLRNLKMNAEKTAHAFGASLSSSTSTTRSSRTRRPSMTTGKMTRNGRIGLGRAVMLRSSPLPMMRTRCAMT